jgi:hypothetical protein
MDLAARSVWFPDLVRSADPSQLSPPLTFAASTNRGHLANVFQLSLLSAVHVARQTRAHNPKNGLRQELILDQKFFVVSSSTNA